MLCVECRGSMYDVCLLLLVVCCLLSVVGCCECWALFIVVRYAMVVALVLFVVCCLLLSAACRQWFAFGLFVVGCVC